ncbi:MAG: beta-N-acetylglucosaminidase domain-containing protein [Cellulosilyticaceae bacterium]
MYNLKEITATSYELFPKPQQMMMGDRKLVLTESIHVIVKGALKEATLPTLQKALAAGGFTYSVSDCFEEGKTNIYLATQAVIDEELEGSIHEGVVQCVQKKEGYQLAIGGAGTEQIMIVGADRDGLHYGVVTLIRILEQVNGRELQTCTIVDYPDIIYRGYIEGFYGFPWSHEDRMDLMTFCAKYKLNTYIYAPKDDPYHRSNWREFYPEDKGQQIRELAQAGHDNNLNFVWTIHPGDSIDLGSEEDFQSAVAKLEQLYTLGVRQFGILFDDIGGVPNGKEQAEFINRIDTAFVKAKGDVRPLLTVGTRYCEAWGPSMTEYFKPFVETLHEDVEIMWTGAATMSNISKEQFDAPKRTIECDKNLSVWWNYPVNDYCDQKILMGKIENLSADVDNINGFFSNPMNQAQASKQALFCIADHNWNTANYDCEASFKASFKALAPEVAEALETFATHSCYLIDDGGASGTFLFDESWTIKEDVAAIKQGVAEGLAVTETATRLLGAFGAIETAAYCIEEKCENAHLIEELRPFLAATKLMATAGQSVIRAVQSLRAKELIAMEQHIEKAFAYLNKMEECKVLRLKEGDERYFTVDVGTLVIKPFIKEMIELVAIAGGIEQKPLVTAYTRNNIALASLGVTATASDYAGQQSPEKALTGVINDGKWCATGFRPHMTIDLQEAKTIKHYRIVNCGHPEARESRMWNTKEVQILASLDGENFTLVDHVIGNQEDEIDRIFFNPVTARYIRIQIIEPAQISINGGGHTRINLVELYEESYPEQSAKVLTSEVSIDAAGCVTIQNVQKGDKIALYQSLEASEPVACSQEVVEGQEVVVFEGIALPQDRLFIERTARNYLPSVRTSKGIQK